MRLAVRGVGIAKDIVLFTPEEVERLGEFAGTLVRSALREGTTLYERPV